ncbi:MAG: FAD-dependent oxidoreductase [bacterium]
MRYLWTFLAACTILMPYTVQAETFTYDYVVYGGTAGGAISAVAAAEQGLKVALLEPGTHIGGMTSGGLGGTDVGNPRVIGGMARDYYEKNGQLYGRDLWWELEPHVAEKLLRDWLDEAGVDLYFQHRLDTVDMDGKRITAITMENGNRFEAKIFADGTYEGDILPRAGISYTWGREGQDVYGESLAGRIKYSDKHQFDVPVSAYDEDGNLLPLIYDGDPGVPGQGDRKVQAYNFRICITKEEGNKIPFPEPPDYDPARWELLRRYLEKRKDNIRLNEIWLLRALPNNKYDLNNRGPISTDFIGESWDYPEASYERRAEIWKEHENYNKGFLYFLQNDPSVPPHLQQEIKQWGLAKDEFLDTDHWPHQLYVREARRMIGEYVMIQKDLQTERTKPDSIGMGSYNSDSHHVQRFVDENGNAINEGDMQVPVQPYEISYLCLTPKSEECENFLSLCTFSASHVAFSSMRMEPQYMIIGQAAGVAAKLAIDENVPVQKINIEKLQDILHEQDAILSWEDAVEVAIKDLEGIVMDDSQAEMTGAWESSTSVSPFVGAQYIHDSNEGKGSKKVTFRRELPESGTYEVRIAYTTHENRATNVPVTVQSAEGTKELVVNQRRISSSTRPFHSLGEFRFEASQPAVVEISNEGTNGYVIVDAVQWIKKK